MASTDAGVGLLLLTDEGLEETVKVQLVDKTLFLCVDDLVRVATGGEAKTAGSLPPELKNRCRQIRFRASESTAAVRAIPAGLMQQLLAWLPYQHRRQFQASGLEARLWALLHIELRAVGMLHLLAPQTLELPPRAETLVYGERKLRLLVSAGQQPLVHAGDFLTLVEQRNQSR